VLLAWEAVLFLPDHAFFSLPVAGLCTTPGRLRRNRHRPLSHRPLSTPNAPLRKTATESNSCFLIGATARIPAVVGGGQFVGLVLAVEEGGAKKKGAGVLTAPMDRRADALLPAVRFIVLPRLIAEGDQVPFRFSRRVLARSAAVGSRKKQPRIGRFSLRKLHPACVQAFRRSSLQAPPGSTPDRPNS